VRIHIAATRAYLFVKVDFVDNEVGETFLENAETAFCL
jgi:hypothetical protein